MTTRPARLSIRSALLAMLAVLSMFTLSGWHNSAFHIDGPEQIVVGQHVHADDPKNDPDSAIHVAAHSLAQGISIPIVTEALIFAVAAPQTWIASVPSLFAGRSPPSPLRPPRG